MENKFSCVEIKLQQQRKQKLGRGTNNRLQGNKNFSPWNKV
jgi:hypothetical protein